MDRVTYGMHRLREETQVTETTDVGLASRRVLLAGAAGVGAVAALAACGGGDSGNSGGNAAPAVEAKKSDIPEGGGKIFEKEKVVITQPTAGTFKAFTAVCTHQGCLVTSIVNGLIQCPCHGSAYSVADGSVKSGPAPTALAEKTVKLNGDNVTVS
jgi:Rieske Fe-S protein